MLEDREVMKALRNNLDERLISEIPLEAETTDKTTASAANISFVPLRGAFWRSGSCGVGAAAKLVSKLWVDNNEYDKITATAKRLVALVRKEEKL